MPSNIDSEKALEALRKFAQERNWEQFHTPKNLAMALSVEVGELVELFQWLTPEESKALKEDPEKLQAVREELADVLVYLIRIADILEIDLDEALWDKLKKNSEKYPVHLSKGNAKKYTELYCFDSLSAKDMLATTPIPCREYRCWVKIGQLRKLTEYGQRAAIRDRVPHPMPLAVARGLDGTGTADDLRGGARRGGFDTGNWWDF